MNCNAPSDRSGRQEVIPCHPVGVPPDEGVRGRGGIRLVTAPIPRFRGFRGCSARLGLGPWRWFGLLRSGGRVGRTPWVPERIPTSGPSLWMVSCHRNLSPGRPPVSCQQPPMLSSRRSAGSTLQLARLRWFLLVLIVARGRWGRVLGGCFGRCR